jgi:hypothetical protein
MERVCEAFIIIILEETPPYDTVKARVVHDASRITLTGWYPSPRGLRPTKQKY